MMESHDEHKNENANSKTGLRVLIGVMVALIAFIAIGLIMAWNWEPPLFPDVNSIQEMTLISVDGIFDERRVVEFQNLKEEEKFHGFPILGTVEITDRRDRKAIISSITTGINEGDMVASCFWPRHGLRIVTADATYDYNICFYCSSYHIHVNAGMTPDKAGPISSSPQEFLNTFFQQAGVPIAPSLEEIQRQQQQEREESLPATEEE